MIFQLIRVGICTCGEKGKTKLMENKHMMFHHSTVALEMTENGGAAWHNDDLRVSTC